jgi:hypothetical protein
VSTRKVDDLVRALGADSGISKSEISRICAGLDAEVAAFLDRSLAEQASHMCSSTPPTNECRGRLPVETDPVTGREWCICQNLARVAAA